MVDSSRGVQWLVKVTNVVDDKSHGSRLADFFSVFLVSVIHDHLVLVRVLIPWRLLEPVGQSVDDLGNVVVIEGEVVVRDLAALVKEWLINEVPSALVLAPLLALDKVGIGGTLSEWMLVLILSPIWIGFLQCFQNRENFIVGVWILLGEDFLSNSGGQQVAVVPPGARKREQHAYN